MTVPLDGFSEGGTLVFFFFVLLFGDVLGGLVGAKAMGDSVSNNTAVSQQDRSTMRRMGRRPFAQEMGGKNSA